MKRKRVPEKVILMPDTDSAYTGTFVVSDNGNTKGRTFVVLGTDTDGVLLLADGKKRRISSPKRKKMSHVRILYKDDEISELIRSGKLTDGFLRKKINKECNISKL